MHIGRWHPGTLGFLWIADLLLLPLLVPGNATGMEILIAVALWLVPTAALAAATWAWTRHARTHRAGR
jgi:hypothetical protein